ncbi:MAG: epimerase [Spirochaeta sp.]|nr:epimerase [Spirochaeta sp.]RPG05329.1 MAG: NAD(P)-dependent oxidoreductase [Proteobacteria bacterium TMED72]
MEELIGQKILVTGPAGQIALPLASRLARENEVWGIARFSEPDSRERVEAAGITTRQVDLADPDWGDLPDDFDTLLHLAAVIVPGEDFDTSMKINAQGTGHLMSRFRNARACLVMSSCAVYASPAQGDHAVKETDPLGGSHQPYAPTYCVSKIAQEAVTRFAAQEYQLPTVLARMNVAYGDNGGLPAMLLDGMRAGHPVPVLPGRPSLCSPIHEEDIFAQTPRLLESASVSTTITNWGGDEVVEIQELTRHIAELTGLELNLIESPDGIHHYLLDPTRRQSLAGRCQVPWREGVQRMIAAKYPELLKA